MTMTPTRSGRWSFSRSVLTTSGNEKLLLMNGIECLGTIMLSWKIIAVIVFICLVSAPIGTMTEYGEDDEQDGSHDEDIPEGVQHNLASMKGWFTENQGQIENSDVKYVYGASDLSIGFIESGYLIKLTNEENLTSVVEVTFEGANRVTPDGRDELPHKNNYFIGDDPSKWNTGLPNFEKVVFEDLYDGIDLIFYIDENGLKFDFIVHPGADPLRIRSLYDGATKMGIDDNGTLQIITQSGEYRENAPISFQMKYGKRIVINSEFKITGGVLEYAIGEYDNTLPLIIDPLMYSTFVGGSENEYGTSIIHFSEDEYICTGVTSSADFPITNGSYDESYNGDNWDVFVLKFSMSSSELLYSTFIGGGDWDSSVSVEIDSEENAYVTGWTRSSDFPTTSGCYDETHNGGADVFVFKLNQDGTELAFSTLIGGDDGYDQYADEGKCIFLDSQNNIFVTGATTSANFPTTSGCFDPTYNGDWDVFVMKMNAEGSELIYSTFIGGGNSDLGYDIAIGENDVAYITGETFSPNFPTTTGSYDTSFNGWSDVFVCELNNDGSDLIFSTFIGGSDNNDKGDDIALDSNNNIYVTGWARSEDFPTTEGCFDGTYNGIRDVIALKLNHDGSNLLYSTFIGGEGDDYGSCMVIDDMNNLLISGFSRSPDFPTTPDCFDDSYNGDDDVFISILNSEGTNLSYSTYIGGSNSEIARGIGYSSETIVYATGGTNSIDFPTTKSCYDNAIDGDSAVFILKLNVVNEGNSNNGNLNDDEDEEVWYEKPIYLGGLTVVIIIVIIVSVFVLQKRNVEFYDDHSVEEDSDEEW